MDKDGNGNCSVCSARVEGFERHLDGIKYLLCAVCIDALIEKNFDKSKLKEVTNG